MDRVEAVLVFLIALVIALAIWFPMEECNVYEELTGRDVEFRIVGGCFVRHGDRMIPREEYKYIEVME